MKGRKTRTPAITKAFIEAAEGRCEDCGGTDSLEIHRIVAGYKGGTYLPRNCKVLCKECHDRYAEGW